MRFTLINDDATAYVDQKPHKIDCSDIPADVHAVQWYGDHGEIEYRAVNCAHCGSVSKKPNEVIKSLGPYQKHVDAWYAADVKAKADAS
jgi:hypothetical protein